jgi:hypothetical protein
VGLIVGFMVGFIDGFAVGLADGFEVAFTVTHTTRNRIVTNGAMCIVGYLFGALISN